MHLGEVQRAVHTARQCAHVHVKGELAARQLEHLILVSLFIEQVDTRAYHPPVWTEHVQRQNVPLRLDAIGAVVRDAVDDAVRLAGGGVGANRLVGGLAPVTAVLTAGPESLLVERVREGVKDQGGLERLAPTRDGARLGQERRVLLRRRPE